MVLYGYHTTTTVMTHEKNESREAFFLASIPSVSLLIDVNAPIEPCRRLFLQLLTAAKYNGLVSRKQHTPPLIYSYTLLLTRVPLQEVSHINSSYFVPKNAGAVLKWLTHPIKPACTPCLRDAFTWALPCR